MKSITLASIVFTLSFCLNLVAGKNLPYKGSPSAGTNTNLVEVEDTEDNNVDCKWGVKKEDSCEKAQEEEFGDFGNESRCYELRVFEELGPGDMQDIYNDILNRIETKDLVPFDSWVHLPEILEKKKAKYCGKSRRERSRRRSRPCRKIMNLISAFKDDIVRIYELTTRITTRQVVLPNIDGLYGGKPCKREDGAVMTKYSDEGSQKKFYGAEEDIEELGACDLQICPPVIPEPIGPGDTISRPCIHVWSEWGTWSKCLGGQCGEIGKRKRKRKCVDACDSVKEVSKEKCRPVQCNAVQCKTITDEDFTSCSPFSPDSSGKWSNWGDWSGDAVQCSDENGAVALMTRKRKCIEGPISKKCPPTSSGKTSGVDTQTRHIPLPACSKAEDD